MKKNEILKQEPIPVDWQTLPLNAKCADFTVPFYEGIDISSLSPYLKTGNYIVVFESVRKEKAVSGILAEQLERTDDVAVKELEGMSGFKFYFRGVLQPNRRCRAFCIWENMETARESAKQPRHREAITLTNQYYKRYGLKGYIVEKRSNEKLQFNPVKMRRS